MPEGTRNEPYVIWSNEHRAWWGANRAGYFTSISSAGRYSRAEAITIARHGRGGWIDGELPPEIAMPERDALAQADANRPAAFQREDEPIVVLHGYGQAFSCASCTHWSPWLSSTGDCLLYAHRRRQLVLEQHSPLPPHKSARTTSADEGCGGWAALR